MTEAPRMDFYYNCDRRIELTVDYLVVPETLLRPTWLYLETLQIKHGKPSQGSPFQLPRLLMDLR